MSKEQSKVAGEIMQAYRDIFLYTPQGKVIFNDMIKASGLLLMSGYREDSELQHMEGAKDMIRRIISILSIDEEQLVAMATGTAIETGDDEDG
jgi:glycerate kinase|tara:strand:+ start:157 stop:435 length:279 start_codon:yes stop_codon:yes gene_type:complete